MKLKDTDAKYASCFVTARVINFVHRQTLNSALQMVYMYALQQT